MYQDKILVRHLGLQPYEPVSQAMHDFTDRRDDTTPDEIWLVEHLPVFTQGQAGKAEHLLMTGDIPVIQSDRGGQVTYHGPGQQVMYVLLNLKRRKLGVRELVTLLEQTVVNTLAEYDIDAHPRADAPGVYVGEMKICSLGLRIRKRLLVPRAGAEYQYGFGPLPAHQPMWVCRYGNDANAPVGRYRHA